MTARTVIVGASIGGVRTAQALRAAGYSGAISLVGDEDAPPYDKPPLSKALLAGTVTEDSVGLLTPQAAAEAGIELVLGHAATGVGDGQVLLDDGTELPYDDVVIATGARARPSPWGTPPGVHVVRSLADARALGTALRTGGPLVVIGAGFIGAEVAATALGMGASDVTVVDPVPVPLSRVLSREVAAVFGELHASRGITTRFGIGVTGIHPDGDRLAVALDDGTTLAAATVVVGIGAVPNDDWLAGSGIATDDGVLCDSRCRSIVDPHVWAVGDVARWWHARYERTVRFEHWTNAVEQAACVAHNITHPESLRTYTPTEYVWSDQYDWKIQLVGRTGGDVHERVDGAGPEKFAVLYADGDRFAGALTVNWPKALITCRRVLNAAGASFADVRAQVENARPVGAR
ncbi:NAD(P)/FAD-dependent oxidoreductase [Amycolatopsis echigonensis]|uniref:NAD(P)/FAD-dependent oxidoreductase n=1 Tax=Amycolatopsis echigonensis TaxID=2576905 RepID=A0A8E1W2V0_9PSEU|nr:FAD/NAD(P)-binding oxidoreductase [Amycolatopsis echigonensis]MBB2502946.1 NAD(P)/FAD-dependent oxidoreductase [Amycolatopsis echigonensis]